MPMIPAPILSLLEPLETFEAIRRKAARLGDRLCDLSYANPYQGAQEGALAALRDALEERRLLSLQYTPFGGQTIARRLVADALRRSHALPFAHRDVILTPGAMAALQIALLSANAPGGEVIVPTPCWLDYPVYVRHVGGTPVMVPPDRDAGLDLDAVAAAVTERTRAVLLSHPANPTGRNLDPATLASLAEVIAARGKALGAAITLIGDETHRDFTAPGSYHSLAGHFARTVIVYSFGKYHFLQGQRLGYAAVSPSHPERDEIGLELERWTRITGVATPTALMQQAIPRLLALTYDQGWLDHWRGRMTRGLRAAGYRVAEGDSTLFVYVGTPPGFTDWEFTNRLAARGVLVLPAPVFHHTGWFRLALTGSEPMLERALDVFGKEAAL
ncbi:aminotransferase class I/II-fold pyridoxal phosphate-dependent enzyme [Azospirillum sp. sgz302134]